MTGAVGSRENLDVWARWHRKRKIGRRKVSHSILASVVRNLTEAWWFAAQALGLNFNLFMTIKPRDINDLTLIERIKRWEAVQNKIGQFARDLGFPCVLLWSRESDPSTGTNEHLHVLTHIPPGLIGRFKRVAAGWFDETDEIDVKPASYRVRRTPSGKQRSIIGYITKNSPQAAYGRPREYRKGGPILGKRAGCSRNVDAPARARWEARRAIRHEFGTNNTNENRLARKA